MKTNRLMVMLVILVATSASAEFQMSDGETTKVLNTVQDGKKWLVKDPCQNGLQFMMRESDDKSRYAMRCMTMVSGRELVDIVTRQTEYCRNFQEGMMSVVPDDQYWIYNGPAAVWSVKTGKKVSEGMYSLSCPDGTWHFWNADGTPYKEPVMHFRNGYKVQ